MQTLVAPQQPQAPQAKDPLIAEYEAKQKAPAGSPAPAAAGADPLIAEFEQQEATSRIGSAKLSEQTPHTEDDLPPAPSLRSLRPVAAPSESTGAPKPVDPYAGLTMEQVLEQQLHEHFAPTNEESMQNLMQPTSRIGKALYAAGNMAAHPAQTVGGIAVALPRAGYTLGQFARQEQFKATNPQPAGEIVEPGKDVVSKREAAFAAGQLLLPAVIGKAAPYLNSVFGQQTAEAIADAVRAGKSPTEALLIGFGKKALVGAGSGAAIGSVYSPEDPETGAILGAALGGAHAAMQADKVRISVKSPNGRAAAAPAAPRLSPKGPAAGNASVATPPPAETPPSTPESIDETLAKHKTPAPSDDKDFLPHWDVETMGPKPTRAEHEAFKQGAVASMLDAQKERASRGERVPGFGRRGADGTTEQTGLINNEQIAQRDKPAGAAPPEAGPRKFDVTSGALSDYAKEKGLSIEAAAARFRAADYAVGDGIITAAGGDPMKAAALDPLVLQHRQAVQAAQAAEDAPRLAHVQAEIDKAMALRQPAGDIPDHEIQTISNVHDLGELTKTVAGAREIDEPTAQRTIVARMRELQQTGMTPEKSREAVEQEFAPKKDDAMPVAAAIRLRDGTVVRAASHLAAMEAAQKAGLLPKSNTPEFHTALSGAMDGFLTASGEFIGSADAGSRLGLPGHAMSEHLDEHVAGEPQIIRSPSTSDLATIGDAQSEATVQRPAGTEAPSDGEAGAIRSAAVSADEGARVEAGKSADEGAAAAPGEEDDKAKLAKRPRVAGAEGKAGETFLSNGQKVATKYRVIEAEDLQPSHNPETFAANPVYPAGVQGREYAGKRGEAARSQVMTGALRPEVVLDRGSGTTDGPPVITHHGIVVAGNDRSMRIARASSMSPDQYFDYRKELLARAGDFGIDAKAIEGMKNPVLVRQIDDPSIDVNDPAVLGELNRASDTAPTKTKDQVTAAMSRAKAMQGAHKALAHLTETMDPSSTVRDYLGTSEGRDFVRELVSDGVIASQELPAFIDRPTNTVHAEGKQKLEDMLYAAAIGDADVMARAPASVLKKIGPAVPAIVSSNQVPGGYALDKVLQGALDIHAGAAAMRSEAGSGKRSIADFLGQGDMFGRQHDPEAAALALYLESHTATEVTKALREYAKLAGHAGRETSNEDMFGYEPEKPETARQRLFKPGEKRGDQVAEPSPTFDASQADLFTKQGDLFQKALDDPKGPEARAFDRGEAEKAYGDSDKRKAVATEMAPLLRQFQSPEERAKQVAAAPPITVSIVGADASDPYTLLAAAKVLRHPQAEHFSYVLRDRETGKVLEHVISTSGMLNYSMVPFEQIAKQITERVEALGGAEKVDAIAVHNHPAGEVESSSADRAGTQLLHGLLRKEGISLAGHLITDHNVGNWLSIDDNGMVGEKKLSVTGAHDDAAWKTGAQLGQKNVQPETLIDVVKRSVDPKRITVFHLDNQRQIVAAASLPFEGSWIGIGKRVQAQRTSMGTREVIIAVPREGAQTVAGDAARSRRVGAQGSPGDETSLREAAWGHYVLDVLKVTANGTQTPAVESLVATNVYDGPDDEWKREFERHEPLGAGVTPGSETALSPADRRDAGVSPTDRVGEPDLFGNETPEEKQARLNKPIDYTKAISAEKMAQRSARGETKKAVEGITGEEPLATSKDERQLPLLEKAPTYDKRMSANSEGRPIAPDKESLANFRKWFGRSQVVDENGRPLVLYHGTTADFDRFERAKGNVESDFGRGFYFTNTPQDVAANYAGVGPDLEGKIERRAEQLMSGDEYEIREKARAAAREEFVQHEGATMPVYVKMEKPFVLGGDHETKLDYNSNYDDENDEYDAPSGAFVDFIHALAHESRRYDDAEIDSLVEELEQLGTDWQSVPASKVMEAIKGDERFAYATDPDNGGIATNEIVRAAIERAGFDGIIDHTVDVKFGSQRRLGKSMEGMHEGTVHYIAFDPTQIKSAIGNRGTFDPNDVSIVHENSPSYSGKPVEEELKARGIEHKFNYIGGEPYTPDPGRRLRAAKRTIEKQKDDAGLFRDVTEFDTPEERAAKLNASTAAWNDHMIAHERATWQRGIQRLDAMSEAERTAAIAEWNKALRPKSGEYFLDFLSNRGKVPAKRAAPVPAKEIQGDLGEIEPPGVDEPPPPYGGPPAGTPPTGATPPSPVAKPSVAKRLRAALSEAVTDPTARIRDEHPELSQALSSANAMSPSEAGIFARHLGERVLTGLTAERQQQFGRRLTLDNIDAAITQNANAATTKRARATALDNVGKTMPAKAAQDYFLQAVRLRDEADEHDETVRRLMPEAGKIRALVPSAIETTPWFKAALKKHLDLVQPFGEEAASKAGVNPASFRQPSLGAYQRLIPADRLSEPLIKKAQSIAASEGPAALVPRKGLMRALIGQKRTVLAASPPGTETPKQGPVDLTRETPPPAVASNLGAKRSGSANRVTGGRNYSTDYLDNVAYDAADKVSKAAANSVFEAVAKDAAAGKDGMYELPPDKNAPPGMRIVAFNDSKQLIEPPPASADMSSTARRFAVPPAVADVLDRYRAPAPVQGAAARALSRSMGAVTRTVLTNPIIAGTHTLTIASSVGTGIPAESNTLGLTTALPGIKTGSTLVRMKGVNFDDPQVSARLRRLAFNGALRSAGGKGGGLVNIGHQFLFGASGADTRARVIASEDVEAALRKAGVTPDDPRFPGLERKYVLEHVGNYVSGNQGTAVKWLQDSGIAPFIAINRAKLGVSLKSLVGSDGTIDPSAGRRLGIGLRGIVGAAAAFAAASYLLSGHTPDENAPGHEGDMATGVYHLPDGSYRYFRGAGADAVAQFGKGTKEVYLRRGFVDPASEAALRVLQPLVVANRGDKIHDALRAAVNTGLSFVGPGPGMLFGLATGKSTYLDPDGNFASTDTPELPGARDLGLRDRLLAAMRNANAGAALAIPPQGDQPATTLGRPLVNVFSEGNPLGAQGAERHGFNAWEDATINAIYRAKTREAREKIVEQAIKDAEAAGFVGPRTRADLTKAMNHAGVDRSDASRTRFLTRYKGSGTPPDTSR